MTTCVGRFAWTRVLIRIYGFEMDFSDIFLSSILLQDCIVLTYVDKITIFDAIIKIISYV